MLQPWCRTSWREYFDMYFIKNKIVIKVCVWCAWLYFVVIYGYILVCSLHPMEQVTQENHISIKPRQVALFIR